MGLSPGKIGQLFGIAWLQVYRSFKEYCHLLPFEGEKSNFIRLLLMRKEGKGRTSTFFFFLLAYAIDYISQT